jgi:hypothetical protein
MRRHQPIVNDSGPSGGNLLTICNLPDSGIKKSSPTVEAVSGGTDILRRVTIAGVRPRILLLRAPGADPSGAGVDPADGNADSQRWDRML